MTLSWPGVELLGPRAGMAPVLFLGDHQAPRDWSFYPYLQRAVAEDRPVLLLAGEGGLPSVRLQRARELVESIGNGAVPDGCDWPRRRLGLLGHGMGAALAILLGAERPSVRGIVATSAWCTFQRSGAPDLAGDIAAHADEFQLELAARALICPIVLVHGEEDSVAPFLESESLYHWVPKSNASLVLLEKTGHSLGARHPFEGSNKELDRTVKIARDFFAREM